MKNLFILCTVLFPITLLAATPAEEKLQQRLQRIHDQQPLVPVIDYSMRDSFAALRWAVSTPAAQACAEKKVIKNSAKFATTYSADGRPCKIYDLSLPTLRSLFGSIAISQVPVQRFTADDYLNWIDGYYADVYKSVDHFNKNFSENDLKNSWVSQLPFKNRAFRTGGIVRSFKLSDLELGGKLQFTASDRQNLRSLLAQSPQAAASLGRFVDDPEMFLKGVRFDWNDLKKVYEVFLEFDFLPIWGPVDLVDYNRQYKFIAERLIRQVLARAFDTLANYIPEPLTKKLVKIALSESFAFMDQMYDYHLKTMEDTLRMNLNGTIKTEIPQADIQKGLYLTFAARASLVEIYLSTITSGTSMDLNKLDVYGRQREYSDLKQREILFSQLHSDLVLNRNCEITPVHDYFGVCSRGGSPNAVYSLLSKHDLWTFIHLGPPVLHRFSFPAETLLKRGTSWLIGLGLQVFPLPIPGFLINILVGALKGFADEGVLDEPYLLNNLTELKRNNGVENDFSKRMIPWLFAQNINPFLLKLEGLENRVILTNEKYLKQAVK